VKPCRLPPEGTSRFKPAGENLREKWARRVIPLFSRRKNGNDTSGPFFGSNLVLPVPIAWVYGERVSNSATVSKVEEFPMNALLLALFFFVGSLLAPPVAQAPEVIVTGGITVDGDEPLPSPTIVFVQAGTVIQTAQLARDGGFQVSLPQGAYTVEVGPLPNAYILKSLLHGAVDLLKSPLTLTGPLPQDIQIAIGLNGPSTSVLVRGRVANSDQLPTFGSNYVVLYGVEGVLPARAPIRLDGSFEFPKVLPGNYSARVDDGSGSRLSEVESVSVRVTAGTDVTSLRLAAQQLVSVTGRVQLDGQAPLPYVSLSFSSPAGSFFSSGTGAGSFEARVPPGEYRVQALTVSVGYSIAAVLKDSTNFLGDVLKVEPGKPLELIVRARTSLTTVKVRGRVERGSSSAPAPTRITISTPLPTSISAGPIVFRSASTTVQPDGSFEFLNVIPGSYLADLDGTLLHERVPLLVGETDLSGVEIMVPHQVRLKGRLVVEDGGPMPRPGIDTTFVTRFVPAKFGLGGTLPDGDGRFEMLLPEGSYRFTLRELPPGYFLKSVLQAGRVVSNQEFLLARDSNELTLVIGSTVPLRKISGRIVDALNPGDPSSIGVTLTTGITRFETSVGADGAFEFARVPSGTYRVGIDSTSGGAAPVLVGIGTAVPGTPTITISDSDIQNLRVVTRTPPQSLVRTGRVVVEGGGPMPRLALTFNGGGGSIDPSVLDGSFQTWMPVGLSKVVVKEVPKEYVVKAVTYGDTDLLRTELSLRASDTNELRIVVAPSAPNPWKSVSGRLTGLENPAAEPVHLFLLSSVQNTSTTIASDGSFMFPQMLSGAFSLTIQIGAASPDDRIGVRTGIVIADTDIPSLEITAPRAVNVEVVTDGGGLAPDRLHLAVTRRDEKNGWLDYHDVVGMAKSYFNSGDRVEIIRIPFGYRLKSVTYGSLDLLKNPLQFDDSIAAPISIVLESVPPDPLRPEFILKGRVRSPATNPERARVTATFVERDSTSGNFTLETVVRVDGTFQFDRLPPGAYEIRIAGRPEVARVVVPDGGTGVEFR